jgi:pyruvate, water dikinase
VLTPLAQAADAARFGGKAAQLARALRLGLPVPDGFALDVEAARSLASGGAGALPTPYHVDPGAARWAVRSSAVGEDGAQASFAGIHLTRLHVPWEGLAEAVDQVVASAHGESALAYRRRLGIGGPPRMGVVVQRMVEAEVAGVLFTRHPVTGAEERVVEASWGLGEAVVAGLVTPDTFRLGPAGEILERRPGCKDVALAWDGAGGVREVDVEPARQEALCLDAPRLLALGQLAARIEALIDGAHDIEWAFERGGPEPFLLQHRPITARAGRR